MYDFYEFCLLNRTVKWNINCLLSFLFWNLIAYLVQLSYTLNLQCNRLVFTTRNKIISFQRKAVITIPTTICLPPKRLLDTVYLWLRILVNWCPVLLFLFFSLITSLLRSTLRYWIVLLTIRLCIPLRVYPKQKAVIMM